MKTKTKKKTAKKTATRNKKIAPGKTILYLHVMKGTKGDLTKLSSKQVGKSSQSAVAEKILVAALKNRKFLATAMIKA